jgi:ubiquinone/menaquinone biosynthesis C-methylase UbiE
MVNQGLEAIEFLDEKFDLIYGLDVLEHVKNIRKFYENLIRLIDDNGIICLQGSPLWPSDNGHNYMNCINGKNLEVGIGNRQIAPWEHLAYNNKETLKQALKDKYFTEEEAENISEFIFNSSEINRCSYKDFISILNEFPNIYYGQKKILQYSQENKFYEIASKKYSHEELRTKELKLFIRKKLS